MLSLSLNFLMETCSYFAINIAQHCAFFVHSHIIVSHLFVAHQLRVVVGDLQQLHDVIVLDSVVVFLVRTAPNSPSRVFTLWDLPVVAFRGDGEAVFLHLSTAGQPRQEDSILGNFHRLQSKDGSGPGVKQFD